MECDDEALGLLQRIDERQLALKEGMARQREDQDKHSQELEELKQKFAVLSQNFDLAVESKVRTILKSRRLETKDWLLIVLTTLGFTLSVAKFFGH